MTTDPMGAIRHVLTRLPRVEREFLLELVGLPPSAARRVSEDEVVDLLTRITRATRSPGLHALDSPLGTVTFDVGRHGELLACAPIDPLRPLRAGLVTGLRPDDRPAAFSLLHSLAACGLDIDPGGRRDLVSLVGVALGDVLAGRRNEG